MRRFNFCYLEVGREKPQAFGPVGKPGDWNYWPITPSKPFRAEDTHIIATATMVGVPKGETSVAAVVLVKDIEVDVNGNVTQFMVWARNPNVVPGSCAIDWMLISGFRQDKDEERYFLRMGHAQPMTYASNGELGDWKRAHIPYSTAIPIGEDDVIYRFAAPCVDGLSHHGLNTDHSYTNQYPMSERYGRQPVMSVAPSTPVTNSTYPAGRSLGLAIHSHNPQFDVVGVSGHYHISIAPSVDGDTGAELHVAMGRTLPAYTWPSVLYRNPPRWEGTPSIAWHVYFPQPFAHPPIVLATPNAQQELRDVENTPAVVPAIANVTQFGATMTATLADLVLGRCALDWVAFGVKSDALQ